MELLSQPLSQLAHWLVLVSLKGAILVGVILLIQKIAQPFLSASARLSLWMVLLFGLLSPIGWELPLALDTATQIQPALADGASIHPAA